jgi:hypothetical protein
MSHDQPSVSYRIIGSYLFGFKDNPHKETANAGGYVRVGSVGLYRPSSGCTHLYGVISCRSVSLIIRTGGA